MLRSLLARFAAVVAFTVLWIVPAYARAAVMPACEDHPVSVAPEPSAEVDLAGTCTLLAIATERDAALEIDSKVAAMCDIRGASIVAPPRILPIGDARIDTVRGHAPDGPELALTRGGSTSHGTAGFATVADPAILATIGLALPGVDTLLLPLVPPDGGWRAGNSPGIDRPPR